MDKYKLYEIAKQKLQNKHLTHLSYEQALREIAKEYGI